MLGGHKENSFKYSDRILQFKLSSWFLKQQNDVSSQPAKKAKLEVDVGRIRLCNKPFKRI